MYTNFVCIESETSDVESTTKPLQGRDRAQEGLSELVGGKYLLSSFLYMYTKLVCIESETSDVESASKPTKPLRRRGRAQKRSSDLFTGRLIELLSTCTLTLCI